MEFCYNNLLNKGIDYIDEMKDTLEEKIPILLESWRNLAQYTSNGRWRKKLDRDLEVIGTGHYTILKSLNFIRRNKEYVKINDPDQKYKNIYYHFGLIIDCIRQISRSILIFEDKLGIIKFQEKAKTKEEIELQTKGWFDQYYNKLFERLTTYGITISQNIQPENEYISILEPTKNNIKKYNQFRNSIQQYRNILIHNPSIDIFKRSDLNGVYVVKKEQLKKYRFLNEIDKININDLINPIEQVNQDYEKCLSAVMEVWTVFLVHIKDINSHPDFIEKSNKNYA